VWAAQHNHLMSAKHAMLSFSMETCRLSQVSTQCIHVRGPVSLCVHGCAGAVNVIQ
jgi:hypothetical protein